jgi:putative mRNA 3-end processing factor
VLITATPNGLHCDSGRFHVDPWRPVPLALITHAHADHARAGSARYLAAEPSVPILRRRLGADAVVEGRPYGERFALGNCSVSFHPAGHILGSAQVRIESAAGVWVVTGDYKRDPDPSCAAFEPVPCDVLVTEATFALPAYCWPDPAGVVREIHDWWQANRAAGLNTVLFCYSLGKAQRVLAELQAISGDAVHVHGAIEPLVQIYRRAGVAMVPTATIESAAAGDLQGALVLAPPGAEGTPWLHRLGEHATGFCSGWMRIRGARRRRGVDRGFVLSDHVDWPGLLRTVEESGARQVFATHGQSEALVRYLNERGTTAAPLATPFEGEH